MFTGAVVWAATRVPASLLASEKSKTITILHTNDTHSRIEPFPMDGGRNQGMGGAARRAEMIKKIRKEERNVLLFDAGDIFQGTPYFNFFDGELELKLMSEMGYDAATIGNHEFDGGIDNLAAQTRKAQFPFIISNYDFSESPMAGKTIKNKVFDIDGIKVGVYGLGIELNGLVPEKLTGKTKYLDALKVSEEQQNYLKLEKKCDLIICLSHLGFEYESNKLSDVVIAQNSNYLDLIIGGHTHTFMNEPLSVKNLQNENCYIFQVGWAGINLGRIDFRISKNKVPKMASASLMGVC